MVYQSLFPLRFPSPIKQTIHPQKPRHQPSRRQANPRDTEVLSDNQYYGLQNRFARPGFSRPEKDAKPKGQFLALPDLAFSERVHQIPYFLILSLATETTLLRGNHPNREL